VLAWAVREAVTNVIQHSRARSCTISIAHEHSTLRAEILNDGYVEKSQSNSGSGISGIAERVTSQGGQLQAEPYSSGAGRGFRLVVEIPLQEPIEQKVAS
jgi:two-component system sensor histidine kinase DesK